MELKVIEAIRVLREAGVPLKTIKDCVYKWSQDPVVKQAMLTLIYRGSELAR